MRPVSAANTRAHPRSRGENASAVTAKLPTEGSSPLTRGKPQARRESQRGHGLIPAHAGKTCARGFLSASNWAHPRSRGENFAVSCRPLLGVGSSPLTRGKPVGGFSGQARERLIPAHAGKTHVPTRCPSRPPAHPRSRGENTVYSTPPLAIHGSSPLTRGKLAPHRRWRACRGLIPAHAGKTKQREIEGVAKPAHPRSRGENPFRDPPASLGWGSSPLTRGKLEMRLLGRRGLGLIPAHAGKTTVAAHQTASNRAHPRSRGENSLDGLVVDLATGSSPLTRGKRAGRSVGMSGHRLIPAHAGKTAIMGPASIPPAAHPRSRGENTS